MHLLAAQPGTVMDGDEAIDLGQTPGDIIVLSAADSELKSLAWAQNLKLGRGENSPSLRLASILHLNHNMSVDLYCDDIVSNAKLVVVRLLGGRGYWPFGVERIVEICRDKKISLALLPGDDQPDQELSELSSLGVEPLYKLWQYFVGGGPGNALQFLNYAASLIGENENWLEPTPLPRAGLYWPGLETPTLETLTPHWETDGQSVAIVFYRALVQAGNLAAVDALIQSLSHLGLNPVPVYVASLKDPVAAAMLETVLLKTTPDVILNATGFAVSMPGNERTKTPFDVLPGAPPVVLQVVFSGGTEADWRQSTRGLSARDIAMNVALPEVDGRVLSRAVSFKAGTVRDENCQIDIVHYQPTQDRIDFVTELAARWITLKTTAVQNRRVALILANYPNRDGRLGNGVGLDTPGATMTMLKAMRDNGYYTGPLPKNGDALIERMQSGPTNDFKDLKNRTVTETLSMADYQIFFASLSDAVQKSVIDRWGPPDDDPFYISGDVDCGHFAISAYRVGHVAIALQPARGYNINPTETYHSPDLVPPHSYFAFYAWVRHEFSAHAIVHMGKHGNLEWLPGKALALSSDCFPEAALGPWPNLYPFIVNDPGEGTQSKRRTGAVVIDHLTPPLTRAESYGPLRDLEQLVDEYYEAAGVDPRRLKVLKKDILALCRATGIDDDCAMETGDDDDQALSKLDNFLCELKEMQIRDGLHIFGISPSGRLLTDLLVALVRVPRGSGKDGDQSLHRAIADDLKLGFDPLHMTPGDAWHGPQPDILKQILTNDVWRSNGDAVERIELLASKLVAGEQKPDESWIATIVVLEKMSSHIRPSVEACGVAEIDGLLTGLSGHFVEPGPSGAPTRGRPDVLPTGRNFYSVDTRTVPTPAAWTLGWKSATLLMERHLQDTGDWPKTLAISAWGTSNMRTGGDDIAQALALMGVKPTWDAASRRVTGFEIMPSSVLGRPRVDVTLRISGFFRDAFPGLIDLFDSAVRDVAELDEDEETNPLAARIQQDTDTFVKSGVDEKTAKIQAAYRVFGSKPGAYGAGLQALIDEKGWTDESDLARAYVMWGGYAYGGGTDGDAQHGLFENRLKSVDAVLHNQDNREHDILDSDDYYQFEGGMTAAISHLSGTRPTVYHNDHSRPENPRIRTLDEEIARVVRARAANPKWIEGVMRHGYKGAFEMTATVDYLFAFAATTGAVKDHHFDQLFEAYIGDDDVRAFMQNHNPAALKEMAERFKEAADRHLWRTRLNSSHDLLEQILT